MTRCSRCGREDHVEYGADGQPYCSSCIFYGMNKQCGKCRMYLPSAELQQYKGMWMCPYCLQDMRDEDRKASEYHAPEYKASEYKPAKEPVKVISYTETCERCGRETETLYLWNGRKLCSNCLREEQEKWTLVGGGPTGASQAVPVRPAREAKKKSLIESVFSELRALLGMKPKEARIVALPRMPIERARPMVEGEAGKAEDKKAVVQVEGIMKKKKPAAKKVAGAAGKARRRPEKK